MSTANEKRDAVAEGLRGLRDLIAKGRPAKALEYLRVEYAWQALEAIAAGCDDPAGLAAEAVSTYEAACDANDAAEGGAFT